MKYSQERKQAVLDKLQAPYNRTVKELAAEEGISAATIYNWRKQARKRGQLLPNVSGTPDGWSSPEKFNAVLETAALLALRKKSRRFGGGRGKMTNATDRRQILALVNEARRNGARLYRICQELGIGQNTYRRWSKGG